MVEIEECSYIIKTLEEYSPALNNICITRKEVIGNIHEEATK